MQEYLQKKVVEKKAFFYSPYEPQLKRIIEKLQREIEENERVFIFEYDNEYEVADAPADAKGKRIKCKAGFAIFKDQTLSEEVFDIDGQEII